MKAALLAASMLVTVVLAQSPAVVQAEVSEVRLARQYGINYLQLMVMEDRKLIEQHAKRAGLGELLVSWPQMSSGAAMNYAVLSKSMEVPSGGIGPFAVLRVRTRG